MDNVIVNTIGELGITLLSVVAIASLVIQFGKEKTGISDRKAEIFSLIVGFIFAALVAVGYILEIGVEKLTYYQWVGVALFTIVGTIGPAGGYKLVGSFAGSRDK